MREEPNVTIIVYNYNSLHWLRITLFQIQKHTHIPYKLIISDQSEDKLPLQEEIGVTEGIKIVPMETNRAGYAIDYILKNGHVDTEYLCTMDVDCFPVHDDWLTTPIALLNEFDLTWVGLRAEIESYYKIHYFHMNNCFRVGRTKDFITLSEGAGFSWVKGKADDAVMAHSWEDANFHNKKLSLPVTGRIGLTLIEGEYGRMIGNLVLHFCLSFTSTLHANKVNNVGEEYVKWEEKIKTMDRGQVAQEIIDAVQYSHSLQPMQYWDGYDHKDPPEEVKKRVEYLIHKKGTLSIPLHYVVDRYSLNIKGVIHVGAHYGQEYVDYEDNGIKNIMMFEASSPVYQELVKRMPTSVKCYKMALGNKTGVATMFTETANEGMSNSLLEPNLHKEQYPDIKFTGEELVGLYRLDNVDFDRAKYNMLNVDVQGYELEVLKGAEETLKSIDVIYCEVNKDELYKGNPLIEDIDSFLVDFERVETNLIGGNWGDAVYIRKTEKK